MEEDNIKAIFEASYENPKDARKTLESRGYKYDDEFSSPDTKVFVDNLGNPSIAYRGSHRVEDAITDLKLGVGLSTKRQADAKDIAKKVEAKYGKAANAYGHSLGGNLAENSGVSGSITTFNKAVGIKDIFKTIPKRQTDYRTEKDVVSAPSLLQKGGKKITIASNKKDSILKAHKLDAFSGKKKTISSGNPLKYIFN
jgi:hypothetical protein